MGYLSNKIGDELPPDEQILLAQIANLGTPLQYLRVNAAGTGLEYATLPASGGYIVETPSGSLYDQNTGTGGITFTVTAVPVYIVADGVTYFSGAGYTIAGLIVTMSNPVVQYIRSFHL